MKVGCIGAGNHATWTLYPTLQYLPEVELVAICDLDEGRRMAAARRFGFSRDYQDLERMIAKEPLDAVICCGGPKLHALVTERCLEAGIPLFVEKPPAPTAEETRRLARLARQRDAMVMVGFMHRFASATVWARKALRSPEFGQLAMLYAREGLWAMDGKNLVLDSGIHHIDLLNELGGRVEWLIASRNSVSERRHGVGVLLHFSSGPLGQLSLNSLESLSTPSDVIEIHGSQGQWIRIDNWVKATWYKDPGVLFAGPEDPHASSLVYEHGWTAAGANRSTLVQGYVGELHHFFQCLKEGTKPKPDLEDGYRAMQVVEAINRSAETGERVLLEES